MKVQEVMDEIRQALISLGYAESVLQRIIVTPIDSIRCEVKIQSSTIGIYDFVKHTFVD